jgi:hypothetical protein
VARDDGIAFLEKPVARLSVQWHPCQLFALGASLAAHAALVFAFHAGGNWPDNAPHRFAADANGFTVYLTGAPAAAPQRRLETLAAAAPAASGLTPGAPTPPGGEPLLAIAKVFEPHYFRTTEVSVKPFILQDLPIELGQLFPGVPPQSAVFLLFINEQGNIDRVTIEDTELPEQSRQILSDAFANLKFHPAQIDDMPVRSQMKIEITIESVKPQPAANSTP